jgi:hypothetical protein
MLRASSVAAMLFFCCQAAGSDIRRVVTGIDASNIAMFDGRLHADARTERPLAGQPLGY